MRIDTKYLIVIEKAKRNYSAYAPDLPGCVATGRTVDEVRKKMREAIDFHIEGMRQDGLPIPPPSSSSDYVRAKVA
jgi:predicted RNase H-like HicB family nuclease